MFATSTKTATFLPTVTPIWCEPGPLTPAGALCATGCGAGRGNGAPERDSGRGEPGALEAGEVRGIGGLRRLDRGATLVARGAQQLLQEGFRHAICVMVRSDDKEVDRAHVAAGRDRRTQYEQRPAHELSSRLGDDHARVRQVDALAKQVRGVERAATGPGHRRTAERRQPVDVRDAGRTDRVLHAESAPRAAMRPGRATPAVPNGFEGGSPAPGRGSGAREASDLRLEQPSRCERRVMQR